MKLEIEGLNIDQPGERIFSFRDIKQLWSEPPGSFGSRYSYFVDIGHQTQFEVTQAQYKELREKFLTYIGE